MRPFEWKELDRHKNPCLNKISYLLRTRCTKQCFPIRTKMKEKELFRMQSIIRHSSVERTKEKIMVSISLWHY